MDSVRSRMTAFNPKRTFGSVWRAAPGEAFRIHAIGHVGGASTGGKPLKSQNSNLKIDLINKHMSGDTIKYFLALVFVWLIVNFSQIQI
jgi:hypothetical protein